jgi:uncharacterized membrane protein (Fun14 family)
MSIESVSSVAATLGGSFFVSFLVGYFIKKIIKILMFVSGGILALLMYLQSQEMINVEVNTNRILSSADGIINSIATNMTNVFQTDNNNLSILGSNLGIPLTGSIASGLMLGLTWRS